MKKVVFIFLICSLQSSICNFVFSQDDLMKELEGEAAAESKNEKVTATFKGNKIVNAHSCETVKKKTLDFRITHRFSNVFPQSDGTGGIHQFYGLDVATDIRFSLDYGITDKLQVGLGRSRQYENIDGTIKYKILEQTESNNVPITLVWYSNAAFSPRKDADSTFFKREGQKSSELVHRLAYTHQLIIARKFGSRFSFEVVPTISHRNVVKQYENPKNGAKDDNTLYAVGFAGRLKITQRLALIGDYFYVVPNTPAGKFRQGNTAIPYYNPLGVGVEIETGGHVFTLNFTNSSAIIENGFLPYSTDSWSKGAFKFGFNISRVFNI